jgi:hypothetical protein
LGKKEKKGREGGRERKRKKGKKKKGKRGRKEERKKERMKEERKLIICVHLESESWKDGAVGRWRGAEEALAFAAGVRGRTGAGQESSP